MSVPEHDHIADWTAVIHQLIRLHQHIRDLDNDGVWKNELPRVPASPVDLLRAEQALECRLASGFGVFLTHADGWPAFYQWVDLFGTPELLGTALQRGHSRLRTLERHGTLARCGFTAAELLPIAMTREGQGTAAPDLFVQVRTGRGDSGGVLWLADEKIDRFANFDAFFLAMLDYNREEIKDLAEAARRHGRVM